MEHPLHDRCNLFSPRTGDPEYRGVTVDSIPVAFLSAEPIPNFVSFVGFTRSSTETLPPPRACLTELIAISCAARSTFPSRIRSASLVGKGLPLLEKAVGASGLEREGWKGRRRSNRQSLGGTYRLAWSSRLIEGETGRRRQSPRLSPAKIAS